MTSSKKQMPDPECKTRNRRSAWRLLTAWLVALAVAAVILLAFRHPMASAYESAVNPERPPPLCLQQAGCEDQVYDPLDLATGSANGDELAAPGEVNAIVSGSAEFGAASDEGRCGPPAVWRAIMTVGMASDSTVTFLGYLPAFDPPEGDLDDTSFSHDGVEYSVDGLFFQDDAGGVKQLVFDAEIQLPDDLVLRIGNREFPVSESLKLGSGGSIHAWRMDDSLGWIEGEVMRVRLLD